MSSTKVGGFFQKRKKKNPPSYCHCAYGIYPNYMRSRLTACSVNIETEVSLYKCLAARWPLQSLISELPWLIAVVFPPEIIPTLVS
jgi:hypothetical protein